MKLVLIVALLCWHNTVTGTHEDMMFSGDLTSDSFDGISKFFLDGSNPYNPFSPFNYFDPTNPFSPYYHEYQKKKEKDPKCDFSFLATFLQDVTGNQQHNLSPWAIAKMRKSVKEALPEILSELGSGSGLAIASFTDINIPGFGCAKFDRCFESLQGFTRDPQLLAAALGTLTQAWGMDDPEGQLIALQELGNGDYYEIPIPLIHYDSWNPMSSEMLVPLVILNTDSMYHAAGDAINEERTITSACSVAPECCPANWENQVPYTIRPNDGTLKCMQEIFEPHDYPTVEATITSLMRRDITLAVIVASDDVYVFQKWQLFKAKADEMGLKMVLMQGSRDYLNTPKSIVKVIKTVYKMFKKGCPKGKKPEPKCIPAPWYPFPYPKPCTGKYCYNDCAYKNHGMHGHGYDMHMPDGHKRMSHP